MFSFECHPPPPLQYQPLECCLDCHSFQLGTVHKQKCRRVHSVCSCIERICIPRTVAVDDFQEFFRRNILVCHDWDQLTTFVFPSPFSLVHFIGHPHPYHDMIVHSLAVKVCCRRCGGLLFKRFSSCYFLAECDMAQ